MGYLPGTVPAAQVVPSGPAAPVGYAVMVSEGGRGGMEGGRLPVDQLYLRDMQ